jgi:trehalose synthase-fused probable maltokinase
MNSANSAFTPSRAPRSPAVWVFAEGEGWRWLETEVLPRWLPTRRWFGGKARALVRAIVEAAVPVAGESLQVLAIRVEYAEGRAERYAVPLGCSLADDLDEMESAVIAFGDGDDGVVLHDAVFHPQFRATLLDLMQTDASVAAGPHSLSGMSGASLAEIRLNELTGSRVLGVEQSNTSVVYGARLFLKLFRRLQPGVNPDAEITRFLSERQHFAHVPPFAGALELRLDGGESMPFGLLLGCVENRGDAWRWALEKARAFFAADSASPDADTLARIAQLGQRTAEMHLALAADASDPDFRPEPLSSEDFRQLSGSVLANLETVCAALRFRADQAGPLAAEVLAGKADALARIAALAALPLDAVKTRHHGDYHLGQVLDTGADWMIIDFEGEPLRPLAERRAKRSPLRDVAGMLRSWHYAAHAARPDAEPATLARAEAWADTAAKAFLDRYLAVAHGGPFLPSQPRDLHALLEAFVLEKALYEIDYELNNRPDWLAIPLRGFLKVLSSLRL